MKTLILFLTLVQGLYFGSDINSPLSYPEIQSTNFTYSLSKSDTSQQCKGIAKSTGERCKLRTKYENGYCYLHTCSWMRYLNGAATITIDPMELEADISFRIFKSKTIIFSMDMHFYDEMYEHLTMLEDFQKYIDDHERRLQAASENRYRISKTCKRETLKLPIFVSLQLIFNGFRKA